MEYLKSEGERVVRRYVGLVELTTLARLPDGLGGSCALLRGMMIVRESFVERIP